jgi:hypothetical protein
VIQAFFDLGACGCHVLSKLVPVVSQLYKRLILRRESSVKGEDLLVVLKDSLEISVFLF